MRYMHPVQAHERFLAAGCYRFYVDGERRQKTERWTMHRHADGETFVRIDLDALAEEGKSILAEALLDADGGLVRFDIRYENASFEGGVKQLGASWHVADERLQIGFSLNGGERDYTEVDLPGDCLIDLPLLALRGEAIKRLAAESGRALAVYALMYEHAPLFPGVLRNVISPVEYAGDEVVWIGNRQRSASRYRYVDKAAAYWIDRHGLILKRVNSFKQREFAVEISNYAAPAP